MKILICFLLTINAFGLDFQFIAKVPTQSTALYPEIFCDRNDGAFIYQDHNNAILVLNSGQFFQFKPRNQINQSNTNTFIQNENGKTVIIKEEISISSSIQNSGFVMLKTANQNNFIKEERIYTNATTILYSISLDKTNIVSESSINESYTLYSKLNYSGEIIESKKTKTTVVGPGHNPNIRFQGFSSNKSVITFELK